MNPQHQQARNLYFQTDMTQADIAAIIGVSDQTVYRWIKQNNWKQMKEAARQAPIAIVEMLYKQLHALNQSICTRNLPIPTLEEAEITRKLINSIDKLKKQASLSENIQMLMNFTGFLNRLDPGLAKQVVIYADHYLKEKRGVDPLGFYEDAEEEITNEEPREPVQSAPAQPIVEETLPKNIKKKPVGKKNSYPIENTPSTNNNVTPLKKRTLRQQELKDYSERVRLYKERKERGN